MHGEGTEAKTDRAHRKGVARRRGLPKEQAAASETKGTGPWLNMLWRLNMLARLERRCDGEGRRGGRHRLVEGSDECNDPEEDEGAEALRAALCLARRWIE